MVSENTLYCSFCSKSQHEVRKLISGPSIYICDECVELCNDIIRQEVVPISGSMDKTLLTPEEIVAKLNEYVVHQQVPKELLAVAAYQHYKRMAIKEGHDDVVIEKSNVILIGPSGSGKTILAESLAKTLNVPFAIGDATTFTEAGYVGKDVESVLGSLLQSCNMDIAQAEYGIVFIDEIDKLGGKESASVVRDVGGVGVQNALLKMIEGAIVEVPPDGGRRHPGQEALRINTKNILFIFAGAFDGMEKIIEARLGKSAGGIGFGAENIKSRDAITPKSLMHKVTPADLIRFGLDPQFVGRVPVKAVLDELDVDALCNVLTKPKNALIKQYVLSFALDGAELVCDDDAVIEIAKRAVKEKTGARGLRTICETIFHHTLLKLPTYQKNGQKIAKVHLRAEHVREGGSPEMVPETRMLVAEQ